MKIVFFPNAKINIGLYVVEKRPDGYHNLETVFYPLPVCDELVVSEVPGQRETISLLVEGMQVTNNPDDNLIVKAFRLLEKDYNIGNTAVYLRKQIPFGAGLGGGSSDAAFMLKALNDLYQLKIDDERLESYAVKLGADCPFFIRNKPVLATGIGNIFLPLELSLEGYQYLLIKPDVHISTALAYAGVRPSRPQFSLQESIVRSPQYWKDCVYNDFEVPVFTRFPEIADLKTLLYDSGAIYASMSGSGSSLFGIFAEGQLLPIVPDQLVSFSGVF